MYARSWFITLFALFALLLAASSPAAADPGGPNTPATALGTGFTYQGQLQTGGTPVSGNCDMAFRLYDADSAGVQVGGAITTTVAVAGGLFTVPLDFGAGVFTGAARWLAISVRCPAGSGSFTPLTPRQSLTAAPYALALPGLFTQPVANSPNLIGGFSGNVVTGTAAYGVTIGGGGEAGLTNTVQGGNITFATISGGVGNIISGTNVYHSVIGGGAANTITGTTAVIAGGYGNQAYADYAVVSGGYQNHVNGLTGTVAGGQNNVAAGAGSTVSGGSFNYATVDGATVGGGYSNYATGTNATIGGGAVNIANGPGATIGGGGWDGATVLGNQAFGSASTIGGGISNTVSNYAATVAGGQGNKASNAHSTVSGGYFNLADGWNATVAGGTFNHASGSGAAIGGGGWDGITQSGNRALGIASTIGGGLGNVISATAAYAAIGGGNGNVISGTTGTIGGGGHNQAGNGSATVGGGSYNIANGPGATIGGGGWDGTTNYGNQAPGMAATVSGGISNTASSYAGAIGGGFDNIASAQYDTVGGGTGNRTNGPYATVPGGSSNQALGTNSFAAGVSATAAHNGAFVWSCFACGATTSSAANQFVINAKGGIYLGDGSTSGPSGPFGGTNLISTSVGARLTLGGLWTDVSDRSAKTDFASLDGRQVFNTLMGLPVQTWRYKVEEPGTRHMGPTAQDFFAAFSIGNDNTHLAALDTSGVALAAIQGLGQVAQDQAAQIKAQQTQIDDLQARLEALERQPATAASPAPAPTNPLPPLGWLLFAALALLNLGGLAGYLLARRASLTRSQR
jgi:hypothetical protein